MRTTGEQEELRQIEQELRATDRGFAWQLTLLQGMLRWAAPGRQVYLLALAALAAALPRLTAAALLRLTAAGRWLLTEFGQAAGVTEQTTVMILGDMAWLGWASRQAPGHRVRPAQHRPQSGGRDRR